MKFPLMTLAPTTTVEATIRNTLETSSENQDNGISVKMNLDKVQYENVLSQVDEQQISVVSRSVEGNTSEYYSSHYAIDILAFCVHAI